MHPRQRQHLSAVPRQRRFRRRTVRFLLRLVQTAVILGTALAAALAVLVLVASTRPLVLGPWAGQLAEAQIAARLASEGLKVDAGDIDIRFFKGLVPVVTARDLRISRPGETEPVLRLAAAQMQLHRHSLALGRVRLRALRLDGLRVSVVQEAAGVSLGFDRTPILQAIRDPGQFLAELERILNRPGLQEMRVFGMSRIDLRAEDRANGWAWRSREGDLRIERGGDTVKLDLSLGGLGGADEPGAVTVHLAADMAEATGRLDVTARGLNPARFLPEEGTRLDPSGFGGLDAPVSADLSATLLPGGRFAPLTGQFMLGAGGWQGGAGPRIGINGATARMTLDPSAHRMRLEDLSLDSEPVSFRGTAQAITERAPSGRVTASTLQLSLTGLRTAPDTLLDGALEASAVEAILRYDAETGRLTLGPSDVVTADATLRIGGFLQRPDPVGGGDETAPQAAAARPADAAAMSTNAGAAGRRILPEGWRMGADIATGRIGARAALALWPPYVEASTRGWALAAVQAGEAEAVRLSLRLPATGKMEAGMSFRFHDALAVADPGLPAFEAAAGFFSLQDARLAVVVDRALLPLPGAAPATITGASIVKADVRVKETPLEIAGHATGTAGSVLAFLETPLIQGPDASEPLPLKPSEIAGDVGLDMSIQIPMGPDRASRKLRYRGQGRIAAAETGALIPGRTLVSQGLDVTLDDEKVQLSGPVTLDGFPADVTWSRALGRGVTESRLGFRAPLTQAAAASFGVPLAPGEMTGTGQARGEVVLPVGGRPQITLTGDLTGAAFRIPALGWSKPAGRSARLDLAGQLGPAPSFERLRLDAPGLAAEGSLKVAQNGRLERLDLSRARIGGWFDGRVAVLPDSGRSLRLEVASGKLDLRGLPSGGGGKGGPGVGPVKVALDRVSVDDKLALTAVTGDLDLSGGAAGTVRGRLNGGVPVRVTLSDASPGPAIRVRGDDAGGAARDAGLFPRAYGGKLDLRLTPTGRKGEYLGKLRVEDTVMRGAPVAANLLSAISLVGLAEQAGTGGLAFGRIDADFLLTPDRVVVSRSSATGPSLGLSLDGTLDLNARAFDMQGVISPFYFLNRVGAGMTRRGEGLFGITFRLRGPFDDPKVSANPLSVLAPGMFREIFRREPPKIGKPAAAGAR